MLKLTNVVKSFNSTGKPEDKITVLNGLNLTINDGEFVTIIGQNGSGKSTTMNLITGVMFPDSGSIELNGGDITKEKEHARARYFGRVFQDPMMGTVAEMSVLENMEIAIRRGKFHSPIKWGFRKEHKELFIEALKEFDLGLENRLSAKAGTLSGGQRQALTLLMATMPQLPSHKSIRKDYVKFSYGDKQKAMEEVEGAYKLLKDEFIAKKSEIKADNSISKKEKKELIRKAFNEFDTEFRKYDVTKPLLLLDEHTAALDPKTAKRVLTLTNKIVREKGFTTLMVTHNMKDAIAYGDRLIMFAGGEIVLDVKGEEKKNLKIEDLLNQFEKVN
ncbi:MAG: ATP-binding cassette domain-containing protein [Bacilli bacterium]|nr:ATP-binding cassette domain-containing protein [Bacilli bacterium]